jgi:hypothetical protein
MTTHAWNINTNEVEIVDEDDLFIRPELVPLPAVGDIREEVPL